MLVADVLATLIMILVFAENAMPTNESPTNLRGDATPADKLRPVCAVVHLNLSCPHPFRAHAFLWQQIDEDELHIVHHRWLESRDRWAATTLYGCSRLVPKSRLPYRTRFSITVPEQNCVADWESHKEWVLVGSQNQIHQTYDMRWKLTPHSNAEVEVKTAGLSTAANYCIKAHFVLTCTHAFSVIVQIRTGKAEPKPIGYMVAEKELRFSEKLRSDDYFVEGTLKACIPLDEVNFSSPPSAFYFHAAEHTCPEAHYETVELPHATEVKEYGVILYFSDEESFSEVEANVTEAQFISALSLLADKEPVRQTSEEPVLQHSTYQTNAFEADITELSTAANYCIKAHFILTCTHAFTATVQIRTGKAEPKPIGYVVAEKELWGSQKLRYDAYFVAGTLKACIPLDEVNFSSPPSAFYLHVAEHTCSEDYKTAELPHAMEVKEYGMFLYFSDEESFADVEANVTDAQFMRDLSLLADKESLRQNFEEPVLQRSTYQTNVFEADIAEMKRSEIGKKAVDARISKKQKLQKRAVNGAVARRAFAQQVTEEPVASTPSTAIPNVTQATDFGKASSDQMASKKRKNQAERAAQMHDAH